MTCRKVATQLLLLCSILCSISTILASQPILAPTSSHSSSDVPLPQRDHAERRLQQANPTTAARARTAATAAGRLAASRLPSPQAATAAIQRVGSSSSSSAPPSMVRPSRLAGTAARSSTAKPDSSNYYPPLHGPASVPQGCAALPGCASCLPSSDLTSALYAKLLNPRDPSSSLSGTPTPSGGYYGYTSLACTSCEGPAWRMYNGQCGKWGGWVWNSGVSRLVG